MLSSEFLKQKFSTAGNYQKYLSTGTEEHQRRWQKIYDSAHLSPPLASLVQSFARKMNVLVLSGTWCGDCVEQVPLMQKIAEANPEKIDLRALDRDANRDLSEQVRLNAGDRVPAVIFMSEDFEFCALAGDRTLSRYRSIAQKRLGPACSTGLIPPGQDELSATLQDWLDEFERVQLMLRISPRLRQKYND
jgi:thiol-disulfide isomerase/thioredoxin